MIQISDAIFPDLPGLTWPITKIPEMKTLRQTSISGKEKSAALWSYPRWRFKLQYEYLTDDGTPNSDVQQLMGFFLQRRGSFEDFLFLDKSDCMVTNQIIAIGDGATTRFKLIRQYGGFVEPINGITTVPDIKVNDAAQPFNWDINGWINFTAAPPQGARIAATFKFYYRVRFTEDTQEYENFMRQLWSTKSVELVTIK